MNVYIATDHAGFIKKNQLAELLSKKYTIIDLGPSELNPEDDYPIYAERVGEAVVSEPGAMGILLCHSAQGMQIAAGKIDGVRAAVVWNKHLAAETRRDNDSNVLVLASGELSLDEMQEIANTFLSTEFSNAPRHRRRLGEIRELEKEN